MYTITSNQEGMIKTYSLPVWCAITDKFRLGTVFRIRDVDRIVARMYPHLSARTVHTISQVVLHYTLDHVDPEQPALTRISSTGWKLT